jgi:hypothetical protein
MRTLLSRLRIFFVLDDPDDLFYLKGIKNERKGTFGQMICKFI